jgi:hypothetical protein
LVELVKAGINSFYGAPSKILPLGPVVHLKVANLRPDSAPNHRETCATPPCMED